MEIEEGGQKAMRDGKGGISRTLDCFCFQMGSTRLHRVHEIQVIRAVLKSEVHVCGRIWRRNRVCAIALARR